MLVTHKNIRIQFEVDGRHFEAVGFLNDGERSVTGDDMLERAARENGGAIDDEDETFLSERRAQIPKELQRYGLVTNRRNPRFPRDVVCFGFDGDGWYEYWDFLGSQWYAFGLVLRRC